MASIRRSRHQRDLGQFLLTDSKMHETEKNNMEDALLGQVNSCLARLDQSYHPLLVLVGPSSSGKTSALARLAEANEWPLLNVNLALSTKLLELSKRRRSTETSRLLAAILDELGEIVLLDNIEILFSPDLEQNPLALFRSLARNRTLVVSWPGQLMSGKLTYAEAGHPEARELLIDDTTVVETGHVN